MGKLLYMKKKEISFASGREWRKELRKEEEERGVNDTRGWSLSTTRSEDSGLVTEKILGTRCRKSTP